MFFHGVFLIHKVPSNYYKSYLKRKKELPMNENTNQSCPCCPNHCPSDALQCGKGRAYFSEASETNQPGSDERDTQNASHHHSAHARHEELRERHEEFRERRGRRNGREPFPEHFFPDGQPLTGEEQLFEQFRACAHALHHPGNGKSGQLRILPFWPPEAPSPKDSSWIFWMYDPVP